MKISLFVSGYPRTLFHKFNHNINVIRNSIPDCKVFIFYSFWDELGRSSKINDKNHLIIDDYAPRLLTTDAINQYFLECGADEVDGEIESQAVMHTILNNSPFKTQPSLSAQYYKIHRVIEKYYKHDYDFYVRIRPDILINDFPKEINALNSKTLIVNHYYWFNALYNGSNVNEMIWASKKEIFKEVNSLYLNQNQLEKQSNNDEQFGEALSGKYFDNLLNANVISSISTFNFDYRVLR